MTSQGLLQLDFLQFYEHVSLSHKLGDIGILCQISCRRYLTSPWLYKTRIMHIDSPIHVT